MDPIVPVDPASLVPVLPSVSEVKQALLREASAAKQQEVRATAPAKKIEVAGRTYAELAAQYGADVARQTMADDAARMRRDELAGSYRDGDEFIRDGALSVAGGAVNLVAGLPLAAADAALSTPLNEAAGGNALRENVVSPALTLLGQFNQWREGMSSATKQADLGMMREENAASAEQNRALYEQRLAAGDNAAWAGARRVGADLANDFGNTFEHDSVLLDAIVEQAPTLGLGAAAKAATTAGQVTARTALLREAALVKGLKAGADDAALAAAPTREMLVREARDQIAQRNLVGMVAATEAGGAYTQVAGEIMAADLASLAQRFPEVQGQIDAGWTEQQIKSELASSLGLKAAALTAPLAAVAAPLGAGLMLNPLGRAGKGTLTHRMGEHAADIAGEMLEEGVQGAGSELMQNLAKLSEGDTEGDLLAGVGGSAGSGMAVAAGLSGALRAPAVAIDAAAALKDTAIQKINAAAAKVTTEQDAVVAEQRAAVNTAMETNAAVVSEALPVDAPVAAPIEAEPALSPEVATVLKGGDATAPLSRLSALSRATAALDSGQLEPAQAQQLNIFVAKVAREVRQGLDQFTDPAVRQAALGLVENERVRELESVLQELPDEQVAQYFASIPDNPVPDDAAWTPEVAQAFDAIKELGYIAPDRFTVEQATKVLHHSKRLAPEDKRQLELALDVAKIREQHTAALAEIKTRTKFKSQDVVTSEILETGFGLGNVQLKSISQHVRDISSAMVNGDVQDAALQLGKLAQFADGLRKKATAFDAAAKAQIDAGRVDSWFDVEGTRKLSGEKTLGRLQNQVNLKVSQSVGLIDAVHADANSVAAAYNTLARLYPQAIAATQTDESPLPASFDMNAKPSWKSYTKPEAADESAAAVPADAGAERAPAAAEPAATPEPVVSDSARDAAPAEAAEEEAAADEDDAAARALAFEAELAAAQAALAGGPGESVDFGSDTRAESAELDEALDLEPEAYLARVNPDGETTSAQTAEQIVEELADREVPSRAKPIGKVGDITLSADGDFLYAHRGDDVVGVLGAKASGNEFAVHPDEQGKGLGKAMMRELLVRRPFALSGGLSPAAAATRLAVLRDLRNERDGAPATTVAERFPMLTPERGGSKNQLISAFRLAKKARSLFARTPDPLPALSAAAKAGTLADMMTADQKHAKFTDAQAAAVSDLVDNFVPALVAKLNANLMDAATGRGINGEGEKRTGKGWLNRFLNPTPGKPAYWDFVDAKSLHATVEVDGQLVYQPEIAQAMAMAGLHWAINTIAIPPKFDQEKAALLFEDGVIPPNLLPLFQSAHFYEQPLRTLAQDLTHMLGIQGDPDAPLDYVDGLPKALAGDIARAMADLGMIQLLREKGTQGEQTLAFFRFPDTDDRKTWSLKPTKADLGKASVLTRLLLPDYRDMPKIGGPVTSLPATVQGTNQPLSAEQRTNIKALQGIAFKRNSPLMEFLGQLGGENVQRLLGYYEADTKALNAGHRRTVEGVNAGLAHGWESLVEIDRMVHAYAEQNGIAVDDVPVHFGWRVVSNGRMMMDGFGPQSDKLAREALTANKAVLDLNDERHLLEYYLTIAQALGIKTEQVSNIAATEAIELQLGQPEYRKLIADIQALQTSDSAELAGEITAQMEALGVNTARAIHALFTQARFEQAIAAGDQTFEHYVAFELDGKTDGPVNAMMHFGLTAVDDKLLTQLRQGGMFVNETEKTTLNDHGKGLGDLYGASAAGLQKRARAALGNPNLTAQGREILEASIRQLKALDMLKINDDLAASSLEVGRAVAKHGVMATVYGSGERSIVSQLAYQMLDRIYAEMSAALLEDRPLDADLQQQIRALMGQKMIRSRKGTFYRPVPLANLDRIDLQSFEFSADNIDALVENLRGTVGGMLVSSINGEMMQVKTTMAKVIAASTLQTAAVRRLFTKAYEAKRQALIAAGELDEFSALSRNQEQEILKTLAPQLPAYGLLHSEHGVNVGVKDFKGEFLVDGKVRKVASIAGGLSLDINATRFDDPGVRASALLTIAAGDATMMSLMFQRPRPMLDVYDGLEVTAGEIFAAAEEVNRAVFTGWQFDVLGGVADSFERMELDVDSLSPAEIADIAEQLREEDMVTAGDLKAYIERLREDLRSRARRIAATKQAMAELAGAVDHMAGGQNPYKIAGRMGTVVDPVNYINTRVEEILAADDTAATEAVLASPLAERLSDVAELGISELDVTDVRLMLETMQLDKLHRFVVNAIDHLLPDDLRVFVGTPSAIANKQAELFPGVAMGGDNEVGAYYRNTVFLKNGSPETLVHELVHATTYGLVRQFYAGGKGLTAVQRDAVRSLEQLTREFAAMQAPNDAVANAQEVVQGHLYEDSAAEAVNEFMAWTLTNPDVAATLRATQGSSAIKALAKSVLAAVRKLLGLPNNPGMESFLEQTLGQFHRLVRRDAIETPVDTQALFQSLTPPNSQLHALHLQQVHKQFEQLLSLVPLPQRTPAWAGQLGAAFVQARKTRDAFLDAGFKLSDQEQHVFALVQAAMASGLELNPQVMNEFQALQDAAVKQLSGRDFLADPDSTDQHELAMADRQFNALLGVGTTEVDKFGRSNLLANFVALALVHAPLRAKLQTLSMPAAAKGDGSLDSRLREGTTRVFDWLGRTANHTARAPNQRFALDLLANRLAQTHAEAVKRSLKPVDRFAQVEAAVRNRMEGLGARADAKAAERAAAGKIGNVDGWINGLLAVVKGATSDAGAGALAETMLQMTNTSSLPKVLRSLIGEVIGVTDSNVAVTRWLNEAKHMVSRVRQRLREEVPGHIRGLFSKPLDDATWELLYTAAGKTDLQSLLGAFSARQLRRMLTDPGQLQAAIVGIESQLVGDHQDAWIEGARDLGRYLVEGVNEAVLLRRNAAALARRSGEPVTVAPAEATRVEPLLDRLVTLRALEVLGSHEKATLATLLETEKAGMEALLNILRSLTQNELGKPGSGKQRLNRWKGYVPQSLDPRSDLVLAGPKKAAELVKRGYRLVKPYGADFHDPDSAGLAYYASTISVFGQDLGTGGQMTYNQGALQTVEGTVGGVDRLTGQTLDPAVKTSITHPHTVAMITRSKLRSIRFGQNNLLPIFDDAGKVVGYERLLDRQVMDVHLRGNRDLSKSIGIWMGRQAEESIARSVNEEVVGVLHDAWEAGVKEGREKEFVDVSAARNATTMEAWGAIPRETQRQLKAVFQGGPVMVRKDMLDNALGYRSASIADVFTGMSELPVEARQLLEKAAYGVLGKDAYGRLVVLEKTWQGLVGTAKDWIVVRSGVVALANAIANQWQLLMHGVPPTRLLQMQARKVAETETYLRNERRLSVLGVEMAAATRPDVKARLERERQLLVDANLRLSIYPLIEAGELPSIAEGLSEQDEYTLLSDATKWLEDKAKALPPGVMTFARYATISKDTAIYQGLNRAIQFGDFMAKAALYEHLLSQGKSKEQALRVINERFVNYNLLAGRTRDYAESMGLTWFLNYKLRIQKVVLATIRENPLRFLLAGAGADWLGADSLVTSSAIEQNWGYAVGPGQFFRAHDMLMWNQLVD